MIGENGSLLFNSNADNAEYADGLNGRWCLGILNWFNRLWCTHELILQHKGNRKYVICLRCPYESKGITVGKDIYT